MSNTDDRKLLEDAARAMGLAVKDNYDYTAGIELSSGVGKWWNPLNDDGDCLRMEEQMKLWAAWDGKEWIAFLPRKENPKCSDPDRKRASTMCVAAIWREL